MTAENTMREDVARAIFAAGRGDWTEGAKTWEEEPYYHEHHYRLADAAIAAITTREDAPDASAGNSWLPPIVAPGGGGGAELSGKLRLVLHRVYAGQLSPRDAMQKLGLAPTRDASDGEGDDA